MSDDFVAEAEVEIDSPPEDVWAALVEPDQIEQYMFGGPRVETDWEVGHAITWSGEWKGTKYEDKGEILEFQPQKRLQYSHFSPISGLPDVPESYHTVTIDLSANDGTTNVRLLQDNNPSDGARSHSQDNWQDILDALKEHVEA